MGGDRSTSPQGQGRRGHSALGTVAALGVIADPPSPSSPNPSLCQESLVNGLLPGTLLLQVGLPCRGSSFSFPCSQRSLRLYLSTSPQVPVALTPVLGGTPGGAGCCYLLPLPLPPHCSPSSFSSSPSSSQLSGGKSPGFIYF